MERLLLWIRRITINRAVRALSASADSFHQQARHASDPKEADRLRQEADADADAKKELWAGGHRSAFVHDHSVSGNSAPVQQTTVHPSESRSTQMYTLASGLALSLAVNVWCGWTMRDIGTRKWLHDYDLNQFQQGDFAKLKSEVSTMKDVDDRLMLIFGPDSQCRKPK